MASYPVADFAALAGELDRDGTTVVDVRQADEYAASHVRGAVNVPVQDITDRIADIPDGVVWVHCASGYRASVAASLLARAGRSVVLVDDAFDSAKALTVPS